MSATELYAALGGTPQVSGEALSPSVEATKFGDWVKAGALKSGDRISTAGSITKAGPRVEKAANDASVSAVLKPHTPTDRVIGKDEQTTLLADNDNQPLTVLDILRDPTPTRVYNFEVESLPGEITRNYLVGDDAAWVHNYTFGQLRRAYEEACAAIGGCKGLSKFLGRFGSPSRGDSKCGIRLDPADDRMGPHLNVWDYRPGKYNNGAGPGIRLHIPIK